jgi:hypothetical protein
LLVLGSFLLLHHSWQYYPFFSDDAFISLRYADRLLEGKGLTWTDGERVEGYSNLLWTVSTAALGALGLDLVTAGRAACLLGSIAALWAILVYGRNHHPQSRLAGITGAALMATTGSLAVWTLGGLEATFHAALICWAVVLITNQRFLSDRRLALGTGLVLGLLALNRPDGFLMTGAAVAAVILLGRIEKQGVWKTLLPMVAIPILFFATQTGVRWLYYGELVPNTYHAKFALTAHRFESAATYLSTGGTAHMALAAALVVGLLALALRLIPTLNPDANQKIKGAFPNVELPIEIEILSPKEKETLIRLGVGMTFTLAWLGLVFLGGGDIFPGWRHLVPVIPLVIMMISDLAATAQEAGRIKSPEIWLLVGLLACANLSSQSDKENLRAKTEWWVWLGKVTGEQLNRAWGKSAEKPLVAVTSAGAVSFYSKLPTLDMFGLNDRNLTRNKSEKFGQGVQAHELFNLGYVMGRKPDVIISHVGGAVPEFDMINDPEFVENYELVRFPYDPAGGRLEKGFHTHAWVRKEKLGQLLAEAPDIDVVGWKYWERWAKPRL